MMIHRKITDVVRDRLAHYPAVALVGPRQAGKTTLARSLSDTYFDLEQEADRIRLDLQWEELVEGEALLILDEAQSWPRVFQRLRGAIDKHRSRKGRFLLLGSVSPALMVHVSESLAGRLAMVELTPFLQDELPEVPLKTLWCRGGYPEGGAHDAKRYPRWQQDYLALLAQRDLPTWGLPGKPQETQRLLKMLAAVQGQLWNASQIGQSLGLSYQTVNSYMDYLIGAFLIRRLQPYQSNLKKRLVKSPRVYWRDTGLLHALLQVEDEDDLLGKPWVGASWEGFVIEQVLGALRHDDRTVEPYFFRTTDQYEIDLVLDFGKSLWAVEIKLTSSPNADDMVGLNKKADLIKADKRIMVTQTKEVVATAGKISCNLPWLMEYIGSL
jgi:predicted AAA+ superfamily ATPase